jgi:hypothetical protein
MDKVELPVVTPETVEKKHVSLLLIEDGLRQADKNLEEQETNLRKLNEQVTQLQSMRIATIAQKNLLTELNKRIIELEKTQITQS